MQITFIPSGDTQIAVITSNDTIMTTAEDAAELLVNCYGTDVVLNSKT